MNEQQISVILPVFDGALFVAEAIESVLTQNYDPLQLIVINDGSTDNTEQIVQAYPQITYIYQENAGVAVARNAGLAAATGEYITFIDADDLWPPQKLAIQMDFLKANPQVQIVMGRTQFVYMQDARLRTTGEGAPMHQVTFVFLGSGLYRHSTFDQVGGFNPEIRGGDDLDWFIRAAEHDITIESIPNVMLHRRLHAENLTNSLQEVRAGIFKIIKYSLDRRRTQGITYSGNILPWAQLHED